MAYEHGGNIDEISEEYNIKREEIIDFSANVNPLGIPSIFRKVMADSIKYICEYPDIRYRKLTGNLSGCLSVNKECIIPSNGASEIIYASGRLFRGKRVLIPAPSFTEYEKALKVSNVKYDYLMLKEYDGFKLDIDMLIKKCRGYDGLYICNPNNPTSKLIPPEKIEYFLDEMSGKNFFTVIDESFIELTKEGKENSVIKKVEKYRNVLVIGSLTKIYAVPGLRLGFGAGSKNTIEKIKKYMVPWSVNCFADHFCSVLSDLEDYIEKTRKIITKEKKYIYGSIKKIDSLKAFYPDSNFMLVKILNKKLNSNILFNMMIKEGIMIRDASNFKGLDNKYFRIAVRGREDNIKLIKALSSIKN